MEALIILSTCGWCNYSEEEPGEYFKFDFEAGHFRLLGLFL